MQEERLRKNIKSNEADIAIIKTEIKFVEDEVTDLEKYLNNLKDEERLCIQNRISLKREQILQKHEQILEKLKQITAIKEQQAEGAELELLLERKRVKENKERDASKIITFRSILLILISHFFKLF